MRIGLVALLLAFSAVARAQADSPAANAGLPGPQFQQAGTGNEGPGAALEQALPQAAPVQIQAPISNAAPAGPAGSRKGSAKGISTKNLRVEVFKTADGKQGWRARIPGGRALATPAVDGGLVFVGGGFGSREFYAFDAETGAPRWAVSLSDDGPTAAVVSEGRVVFNTESCTLFVLDAKTGKHLWSRWLGDPLMSQPAVHEGVVYMAYPGADHDHRLIALSLRDGKTVFERKIAGDAISAPVIEGDSVYLTTLDGTVYRYALADGKLLFKKPMRATSAPWIAEGEIHVAQRTEGKARQEGFQTLHPTGEAKGAFKAAKAAPYLDPAVQANTAYARAQAANDASVGFGGGAPAVAKTGIASLNTGRGTVSGLWEFQGSRPIVVGGRSYASQGDVLRAMEAESGKVLWEKQLDGDVKKVGGHLAAPPALAGGKLVLGTVRGELLAFDSASGAELFRYPVKDEIRFQPALVGGRVFAGTAAGTLVAIQTGDASLDGWTMWGGSATHNGPASP